MAKARPQTIAEYISAAPKEAQRALREMYANPFRDEAVQKRARKVQDR